MKFKIEDSSHEIRLTPGSYSVYAVGGFQMNGNFKIKISNGTTLVDVVRTMKVMCYEGGGRAVKYAKFNIEKAGVYVLRISNTSGFSMGHSRLVSLNLFSRSNDSDDCYLLIRRT